MFGTKLMCKQLVLSWVFCCVSLLLVSAAELSSRVLGQGTAANTKGLSLAQLRQRVLAYNETIQIQMLEVEISRKVYNAEKGIFEPQVVGSIERVDNQQPNNARQRSSLFLFGSPEDTFERNTLYNGGLEFLLPTGARLRTGYTLRDLRNNVQGGIKDYETFVGTSVVQPLLKGAWQTATLARIRLAAIASDLAFQEYRRQMMLVLARSEAAYWDLFLTQEQEKLSDESVNIAQALLKDNQTRMQVGKSSELEVFQAEAGLALRKSRQSDARTKRQEGANRLATFFSDSVLDTNLTIRALDQPAIQNVQLGFFENYERAFKLNPDYLTRTKQVQQENIRVAYARSQRLPQLDLKASYGLNGLGRNEADSMDDIANGEYAAWSVGLEMRIPVLGGKKEKNEFEAAKLSKKRALIGLKEIEIQLANALDSALFKVRSYLENVQSYQSVVDFQEKLLASQLAALDVGKMDSRTVLETEEKLFEAKLAFLDNLTQYQKALLELELVNGSALEARNLDLTKPQLETRTGAMLKSSRWSDAVLERVQREFAREYDQKAKSNDAAAQERALEVLRRTMRGEPIPPAPRSAEELDAQQKALETLRRTMKQETAPPDEAAQKKAQEVLRQKMREMEPNPNRPK